MLSRSRIVERRLASGPNWAATSTITSPTRCTPSVMPSAARLSTATWLGQKRRSLMTSVTTRFTSSGIARSNERSPDST